MKTLKLCAALIALTFAAGAARADDAAARRELAPTGKLRVAIGVGITVSAFYTMKDAASGKYVGVPIALGAELARKLGVPLEYVAHANSGEIVSAANAGVWDVTFLPVDAERRKAVDFAAPYHVLQSTYLVPQGSAIQTVADANRAGVRVIGVKNTATFRASSAASPNAAHAAVDGPAEALEILRKGEADALALGRESLTGIVAKLPGSRVLDGGFLNSTTAAAVPKGKPAALAYVRAFIEEAKASGLARRAFDDVGLKAATVGPAGMQP
jgi:polar amino acid transport system substrate-binding protein